MPSFEISMLIARLSLNLLRRMFLEKLLRFGGFGLLDAPEPTLRVLLRLCDRVALRRANARSRFPFPLFQHRAYFAMNGPETIHTEPRPAVVFRKPLSDVPGFQESPSPRGLGDVLAISVDEERSGLNYKDSG